MFSVKSVCRSLVYFQVIFFLGLFPQVALAAAPATPSAPTVTATGTTSISISWSSVSTATQYKLYRSTSSGGAYSQIYWGANRSYTDSGNHLSSNTTYYYKLTAGNSANVYSSYSSVSSATTWAPIPSTPSTPTVSATSSSSISISWSSVANATNYRLYRATSSGGAYSQIYYSSATSYTDSGSHLSASTTYYYKLKASNNSGDSGYSSVGSATTWAPIPSTPSTPTVSATGTTSISISWSSVANATNYRLYRATSSGGAYSQIYYSSATSYTDSGSHLSASTTYYYKLKASNNSGDSGYSSVGSATTWVAIPAAPSTPTVSATGPTSIDISWGAVNGATNYRLYRSTSSGGTYTQIYYASGTSYTDSGSHLSASTTYYYKVKASNSSGDSGYSSVGSATTWVAIPAAPSTPTVSATGPTSIDISWGAVNGATNYRLYRSTSSGGTYTQIYYASGTSYSDSGSHLSASTTYYYKVKASNSSGDSSYSSAGSTTTWATIPSSPTPTASATSSSRIDISWSAVNGATLYKLYRSTSANGTFSQIYYDATASYTDSGSHLSASTMYYYKAKAGNSSGWSDFSSATSATTLVAIPATPSAPTVQATSSTSLDISWSAVTDATEYKLYRSDTSGGTFSEVYSGGNLSYEDSGTHLGAATTYYYKIKAGNSSGWSDYSTEENDITSPALTRANSCANNVASGFTYPLQNWVSGLGFDDDWDHDPLEVVDNGNQYWDGNPYGSGDHHMGVDGTSSDGITVDDAVYAPCSGIVKEARLSNGYGGIVILECWTGSECVSPFVAHMYSSTLQVSVGEEVTANQTILGYVADTTNNGGWVPHVHMGIRRGNYVSNNYTGCYTRNVWYYAGYPYTCYEEIFNDMYDPDQFIADYPIGSEGTQAPACDATSPVASGYFCADFSSITGTYSGGGSLGNVLDISLSLDNTVGTFLATKSSNQSSSDFSTSGILDLKVGGSGVEYLSRESQPVCGSDMSSDDREAQCGATDVTSSIKFADDDFGCYDVTTFPKEYYARYQTNPDIGYAIAGPIRVDALFDFNSGLSAPSNLTVVGTGANAIDVTWSAVSGATAYRLCRSASSTSNQGYTQVDWDSPAYYLDSGSHLSPATTYYYKVAAGNADGWSNFSAVVSGSTTSQ